LVGYALVEILTRVFYATRDTMTPVITGVLTVVLNLLLCVLFMESLGYTGLALALSVTTAAEAVILLFFLRNRIGHIVDATFGSWLGKVLVASAVMTAVIVSTLPWLDAALERGGSMIPSYILFVYAMAVYGFAFAMVAWMMRIPELRQITAKFAHRLPNPLRGLLMRLGLA